MSNYDIAMSLARGCYQRAIVSGQARLSGAGLRGRAKSYSGRYARSRAALMRRLRAAGVAHEERGAHNRRVLVID